LSSLKDNGSPVNKSPLNLKKLLALKLQSVSKSTLLTPKVEKAVKLTGLSTDLFIIQKP